jgi:hypothetical protein
MTNDERARILRMVAEKKITAEEAADLLEAIEAPRADPPPAMPLQSAYPSPSPTPMPPSSTRRSLVLHISDGSQTKVNLRIPLGLARAAGRFIPRQAQEQLDEYDININDLLEDLGNTLAVGPLIDIQDDETKVLIAVE